ncbi:MAG: hypothetical protein QM756_13295 [Polyangiaceae bacterium]
MMRPVLARRAAAWLVLAGLGLSLCPSCGTEAKGVEECRAIESARCSAAEACGAVSDVDACKRFYRDQCLHGLSVEAPGMPAAKACVAAIQEAEACARAEADTVEASCTEFRTQTRACERIQTPEYLPACRFLVPDATPPAEGGSGGSADGSGDGSGGTSGSSGAASQGGSETTPSEGGSTNGGSG